ncbi:phosphoglycolate phosphatase [Sphingobium subterraneum]|uniref:Phosphoglycolate phosphatase n=2 Tax=Sphingobium subterraneum TaxID=627688 RepID=A0A841IY50_9SPHN|nr:phosphoglycolate phosphatase [Sphingobium subterraneum]
MMSNRLALFDCDGTLVDSQHDIVEAMNRAFAAVKLAPPPRPEILSVIGLSLPLAMARLVPDAEERFHDHLAEQYKAAFRAMRHADGVSEPLYPGIAELVVKLAEDGWMLGVATGKSDRGLQICLTTHGIIDHFVTLQTADRHPSKPHPSMAHLAMSEAGARPETTVMIGDTSYDMEMAVNAGVRGIGVNWGYHSPQELMAAGAHAVAVDMDDLARHIADL